MKICIAEQCPVDLWTVRQFIIALTAFFGRAIRAPSALAFSCLFALTRHVKHVVSAPSS